MDVAYLEYVLKKKGISRARLTQEMGWSTMTCVRRLQEHESLEGSNWMAAELNKLLSMGFSFEDLGKIFFTEFVS